MPITLTPGSSQHSDIIFSLLLSIWFLLELLPVFHVFILTLPERFPHGLEGRENAFFFPANPKDADTASAFILRAGVTKPAECIISHF